MSDLDPRTFAAQMIRQLASEIGEGQVRGYVMNSCRRAGIKGGVEGLVAEVHDLIGRATITCQGPATEEPEPDPSSPRQIATDLIHDAARDVLRSTMQLAVADALPGLSLPEFHATVDEVQQHIVKATVTVEIPDEVTA